MENYANLGLTRNLRSQTALSNIIPPLVQAVDFGVGYEVEKLRWSKVQGGTLTLGGTNNGNGVFNLRTATGTNVITMNNGSVAFYDATGNAQLLLDGVNEQITMFDLFLGGTFASRSGGLRVSDSGNIYARLNVDDGLFLHNKPLRIAGNTAPAAGTANTVALYVDAGGAGGKNRLMALFDTGAAQVVATEP